MPTIWLEREFPQEFVFPWSETMALCGPANRTPDTPFYALAQAQGAVASILRYTPDVMDSAPSLLVISRTGIGYDKVDVAAATARGIAVCNAPEGPTISTAEHTIMLMLGVAKKMKWAEHELRHSGKRDFFKDHFGVELYGKTLGLVGFGRIARRVARVAQALGMRVTAYDPYLPMEQVMTFDVTLATSFDALLQTSDVVSLHVPLSESTYHLMDAAAFARMKPGAIFINTARGGLVDEAALLAALDSGHLFGAGLDVTDPSPAEAHNPLLHRHNVIVTPHIASATTDAKLRILEVAVRQVVQVLQGEPPPYLVNPEVWPRVLERRAQQI